MQFTEMSQKQAEKLVKEFVKAGQARKKDSDEMVRQIVDRGRNLSEQIVAAVQAELAKQMSKFAVRLDDVESRVETLAAKVGVAAKTATGKVVANKPAAAKPAAAKPAEHKPAEHKPAKMAPAAPAQPPVTASPVASAPVDAPAKADSQSD